MYKIVKTKKMIVTILADVFADFFKGYFPIGKI